MLCSLIGYINTKVEWSIQGDDIVSVTVLIGVLSK